MVERLDFAPEALRRFLFRKCRPRARAALALLAAAPLPLLAPVPADAACSVSGSGTVGFPNSGDTVNCTGAGLTDNILAGGVTGVTVNIGNGTTPTSLVPVGPTPIVIDNTSASGVTVSNQATVSSAVNSAIRLQNGASGNTVTVEQGGTVQTTSAGQTAIVFASGSSSNNLAIAGTVLGGSASSGVETGTAATNNLITVTSTGQIASGQTAVTFGAGGNTLHNAGTISSASATGVMGSSGKEVIVNSGTISGGGGVAINFAGGIGDSLEIHPGSTIVGNVIANGGDSLLILGGTGNGSFDLSEFGSGAGKKYKGFDILVKDGTSTWTLTGTTVETGNFYVLGGNLIVNGSTAQQLRVDGTGVLGGTGTLGSIEAQGGTVAPGTNNAIGTLNVNGNVLFQAAATYQVKVDAAGQADKIAATGAAVLNGATVQIVPLGGGFSANTQYTILTAAGGVSGTFGALKLNAPLVAGQFAYDANNVYFLLQQTAAFASLTGLTPNQTAVAVTLDNASSGGGASTSLSNAVNKLLPLSEDGIKSGLDDLAGQSLADSRRFAADQVGAFQNFMWNAGAQARDNTVRVFVSTPASAAYARIPEPVDPIGNALNKPRSSSGYSIWSGGYGSWDRVARSDIAFGTHTELGGAALGVEAVSGDSFAAGMAIGASSGKLRSVGRADNVRSDAGHAGLYARGEAGGLNVASAISYSFAALESRRTISFLNETAEGAWHAHGIAATLGLSRIFQLTGAASAEPFARLDWTASYHRRLAETGAPGVNLLVEAGHHDVLAGTAGLRVAYDFGGIHGRPARLWGSLGVRHDFHGSSPSMTTAFEGAPAIPFVIGGIARPRTALLTGAELQWALTPSSALKTSYEGGFAPGRTQHLLQASFRKAF